MIPCPAGSPDKALDVVMRQIEPHSSHPQDQKVLPDRHAVRCVSKRAELTEACKSALINLLEMIM